MSQEKQIELFGLGYSKKNKKFKFILNSTDYGKLKQHYAPEGWADSELTFRRDDTYKSVIETYSSNELKFVKDAKNYIQTAYEARGIDYEINITIKIKNNATFKYQTYFTGRLDLSTYKIDATGVTCEVINTGFQQTVLNRDSVEVDLLNTKFIGGGENSMEQLANMPVDLLIPEYKAQANADWRFLDNITLGAGVKLHHCGMDLNSTEYEAGEASNQTISEFFGAPTEFFFTASEDREVDFVGTVILIIQSLSVPADFGATVKLYKNDLIIQNYSNSATSVQGVTFTFDFNEQNIDLTTGDVLRLTVETESIVSYNVSYSTSAVSLNENLGDVLESIFCDSFPIFEFTARILQLISGKADPLNSELLGRTDSLPTSYGSDGDLSLMAMTKGRFIREFPIDQETFNGSLEDTFKTLNGIWNIGLGFENDKVRIEDEKYFFDITENPNYPTESQKYQVNQILDLSQYLNNEVIEKEVLPTWYHNEVEVGYGSYEYENIQGLKEFNTKSSYAVPINAVKSKLDITAEYRYDTQGVNKLREKPYETSSTEDVSGDKDVFGFDFKRDLFFEVKTDDDFESVSGGVDPAQSYNLNFTPRLNLERHGNRFRSMGIDIGKEIQWLQSDKNTKLITQKAGESAKPENADIVIGDLNKGYWIPEAYICEAPVNETTIAAIQANPRGVIKIANNKYGWILECQTNNEEQKGEFRLLRVNLNNVKVVV